TANSSAAAPTSATTARPSVSIPEPAHLGRAVEIEQEAEAEVDGAVGLDQLPRRVRKRPRLLERLNCLVVQELEAARQRQRDVAQVAIGLERDAQLRVAVATSVHGAGRIALLVHFVRVPVLGDLALDAVEERGEPPALRVQRGLVPVVDVFQRVLRAAPAD